LSARQVVNRPPQSRLHKESHPKTQLRIRNIMSTRRAISTMLTVRPKLLENLQDGRHHRNCGDDKPCLWIRTLSPASVAKIGNAGGI
jgi:hypothetical protein